MPLLADPLTTPETTPFDPKSPSLCSTYVQVPDLELNPIHAKMLYREHLIQWLDKEGYHSESYKLDQCGQNFVHLKCSNGHEKYARLHCNQEYCPTCGERGSRLHKKRTARAMDRLTWAPILGYVVFTLPDEISQSRPNLEILKALSKKAWDIISKKFDTPGGMIRTHLMGERVGRLHVHINVLFPILRPDGKGMIDQEVLNSIRQEWTVFVNSRFKLSCKDTNVFYKFAPTLRKMRHKIKYVVRPIVDYFQFYTLKDEDKHYILSLKNWHNTRWFGKLSNNTYKKFLKAKAVDPERNINNDPHLSRRCPVCSNKFRYMEIVHKNDLPKNQLRWIDNDTLVDPLIFEYLKTKDG